MKMLLVLKKNKISLETTVAIATEPIKFQRRFNILLVRFICLTFFIYSLAEKKDAGAGVVIEEDVVDAWGKLTGLNSFK